MTAITSIPMILVLTYLLCEALKETALPNKFLPLIACLFGLFSGGVLYLLCPELIPADSMATALTYGATSGLAATGTYEAVMQFLKKK